LIPEAERGLPSEYVRSLMKGFKADLQARIFIIETMSQQAFVYLSENDINIDGLSEALVDYEKNSKVSASKASQVFEHFLFTIGRDMEARVDNCSGIIEYAEAIRRAHGCLKIMFIFVMVSVRYET